MMLLGDPLSYRRGFRRFFPNFYRRRIDEILDRSQECLEIWLTGTLFRMIVIGTLCFISLLILGIPLALAQGILAGIFTFIPNIGPILSLIPPCAISLLDYSWQKTIVVLIVYIAIGLITTNLLTPLVIKKRPISPLPVTSLLGQVFFSNLFGFLGLFLALPLTIIALVWLQEIVIKDILDRWQHE